MSATKTVRAINAVFDLVQDHGSIKKNDYKKQIEFFDELISSAQGAKKELQGLAIKKSLATYATGKPSELPPTKDQFIELYGKEEFDKVKRIGKPRQYFVWTE
jgi:hypothetical protein